MLAAMSDVATSWPGWQEQGSDHPNSSTMEAGTMKDDYEHEEDQRQELLQSTRGVLHGQGEIRRARACRYYHSSGEMGDDDDAVVSGNTTTM